MRASLVERRLHKEVLAGFRGESIFMILGGGDLSLWWIVGFDSLEVYTGVGMGRLRGDGEISLP